MSLKNFEKYLTEISKEVFQYGNATHAYVDILLHLKKKSQYDNPSILMPSFLPAKLNRITVAADCTPIFYEIDTRCNFNPLEIKSLIDKNTICIFAVHYFGRPANIFSLREIADKYNIPLIEDCAHVLYGELNRKPLGSIGDYAIFSVRKMLVLPDGGYLTVNRDGSDFKPSYNGRVRSLYTISKVSQSRIKYIYFHLTGGKDLLHLAKKPERGYIDLNRKSKLNIKKISHISSGLTKTADINKHVEIRRRNYTCLLNALKEFSFLKPLYNDLPVNWTPYSLPVLATNIDRDLLQTELLKSGISCGCGWPESSNNSIFPNTKKLSQSLIEFPIHPYMTEAQLKYITSGCRSFENKYLLNKVQNGLVNISYKEQQINYDNNNSLNNIKESDIEIKIIDNITQFAEFKDQWNSLCEKSEVHIFQTFDWQNLWWKYYGKNNKLNIVVFYHRSELIGIAPFFIDHFKIEDLTILKRLRFIGSNVGDDLHNKFNSDYSASDYLDLIVHSDFKEIVAKKFAEYLFNNYHLYDTIQFDAISNYSYVFKLIIPLLNELNWSYKITKGEICPRIIVPSSISDFMKGISSKIRYQLTKIRRDISNPSLFELKKVQNKVSLEQEFNEFVRLHQQRWNSQGLPGAFIDNRFKLFLKESTEAFLRNGWLHFTSIYSNGNCLAVECAFKYKNYFYDFLKAFDDHSPLSKYRPGKALLLFLIEEAVNDKYEVVDLLRGSEPYKFEIASEWHWIYKVTIGNPKYNFNIRYGIYMFILFSYELKRHLIKEANIMKAQLKNFGIYGLTSHYFPMTFKKIKNRISPVGPANKNIQIPGTYNQKILSNENVINTTLNNYSDITEKQ